MKIKQFDIWLADLNPARGTEPGKTRPVVIIQTDLLNDTHLSTLVCPVTTNVQPEMETKVTLWHSFDHAELIKEMTSKRTGSSHAHALECAVTQIVFSADGMYFAVADAQNTVYVYDIDR